MVEKIMKKILQNATLRKKKKNFKKFIDLKHVSFLTYKTRQGELISSTL